MGGGVNGKALVSLSEELLDLKASTPNVPCSFLKRLFVGQGDSVSQSVPLGLIQLYFFRWMVKAGGASAQQVII